MSFFRNGSPLGSQRELQYKLTAFLRVQILKLFPEAIPWTDEARASNFGQGYTEFLDLIRLQLQGLGLIDVGAGDVNTKERWELTAKGKLRCALLLGHRRPDPKTDV